MEKRDIDSYFIDIAIKTAERGTCPRRRVGAVLVLNKRIISAGYNGSPSGLEHCDDVGCLMYLAPGEERPRCIRTVHAEMNAILRAREVGDTLYCTDQPCINCFKIAVSHNPDIRIVYIHEYPDEARDLFALQYPHSKMVKFFC